MQIKKLAKPSEKLDDFMLSEWKLVHQRHYGEELDVDYWHAQHVRFEAKEENEIVGGLIGEFFGGVLYIGELVSSHERRGHGIGKGLLKRAEEWAKENKGHEVYLMTGKNWSEKDFYLKQGYEVVVDLPNHYSKTDFVFMRKYI